MLHVCKSYVGRPACVLVTRCATWVHVSRLCRVVLETSSESMGVGVVDEHGLGVGCPACAYASKVRGGRHVSVGEI